MSETAQTQGRKVLWVLTSFAVSAPQRRIAELMNGMAEGYRHVLLALDGDYDAARLLSSALDWRRFEDGGALKKPVGKGGYLFSKLWSSRRILGAERPDLLVTAGLGAAEWLAVNRGPGAARHLHFQDAVGPEEAIEGSGAAGDWARRRAFPGKDRLFVADCAETGSIMTGRWGVAKDTVRQLPWGVDLDLVRPQERSGRESGNPGVKGVVFGSLSPLVPEKRHDRILRILASLRDRGRDASLRLVGQGPDRRRLERVAESLGLAEHVRFIERDGLDPEVAAIEMAKMDVYVDLADVSRVAAAPTLALAAGLPFLASDSGAAALVAPSENGLFLRSTQDESALAAAAELLCADKDLRSGIGAANRIAAEAGHSLAEMRDRCAALIEELFASDRLALPAPEAHARNGARPLDLQPTVLTPTPLKPTQLEPTPLTPTELKPTELKPTPLKPKLNDRLRGEPPRSGRPKPDRSASA